MSGFTKVLVICIGIIGLTMSGYFTYTSAQYLKAMPEPTRLVASTHEPEAAGDAHGGGGHGAPSGHGAAPAPDAHGGGGHGAPAPAAGKESSAKIRAWVTLEEMFANVVSSDDRVHTISFKLEVELFDEASRTMMDTRQAMVKNAIIETARFQEYENLSTLAGKLYFKEALVGRVNEAAGFPLIRDMHLASFSLR